MTPSAPNLKSIFGQALEIKSAKERMAYLASVCANQPKLREEVEALLQAHVEAGSFLDSGVPVAAVDDPVAVLPDKAALPFTSLYAGPLERIGTVLAGRYKLIELIGEGGMGTVYMAQQTEPVKRLVAVKVIKMGMDTRTVLARFEAERQALAMMDHPNIARVLDAGATEQGHPFFVMELVKGTPITEFCDARKLTPRQRLELLVPVCHAIQHAHQKGIIHRDVKPSNVLVAMYDDHPVPKVIDFGVAKATGQQLTNLTLVTGFGAVIGTTDYMSPEQASFNQADIDTRSDIYSLGVLLYELLTGSTPLDRKHLGEAAFAEILRVIREVEPSKPSTKLSTSEALPSIAANRGIEPARLTRLIRGELDWIIMKALEKDRSRRYETANGFALDIQRYLADEPVSAGPPSGWYRVRKVLRRNRGALAAAALVAAALVIGLAATTWQAVRAEREANRANGEAERADGETAVAKANADAASENARSAKAREREARRQAALMATNEGLRLADAGDVYGGLSWFVEAMARAPDDADIHSAARTRFAAFARYANCIRLVAVIRDIGVRSKVRFSADGSQIIAFSESSATESGGVSFWNAATGSRVDRRIGPTWTEKARSGGVISEDFKRVLFSGLGVTNSRHATQIWDIEKAACVVESEGLPGGTLSPNGDRILQHVVNGLALWDVATAKQLGDVAINFDFTRPPAYRQLSLFSGDGSLIAGCEEKGADGKYRLRLFSGTTMKQVRELVHDAPIDRVAFSPDSTRIVTASSGILRIWETGTGRLTSSIEAIPSSRKEASPWTKVGFTPDGHRVFSVARNGFQVFDVVTGRKLSEIIQLAQAVNPYGGTARLDGSLLNWQGVLSPDCRLLASFQGNSARVWDIESGQQISALLKHEEPITSVAFSSDGRRLVTAGSDKIARVWEFDRIHSDTDVISLLWNFNTTLFPVRAPESTYSVFATGPQFGQRSLALWDTKTGLASSFGFVTNEALHPVSDPLHRRMVISTENGLLVWDRDKNRAVRPSVAMDATENGWLARLKRSSLQRIDFTDAGNWIIAQSADGFVQICNGATGQPAAVPPVLGRTGPERLRSVVVVSDDETKLAILDRPGNIRVWNLKTGQQIGSAIQRPGPAPAINFVGDGRVSLLYRERRKGEAGERARLEVVDYISGQELHPPLAVAAGTEISQFPNENRVLIWNRYKRDLRLLDLQTGQLVSDFSGQAEGGTVARVSSFLDAESAHEWHETGVPILMGDKRGLFRLELATGKLRRLPVDSTATWLGEHYTMLSEDGHRLLNAGRLWDTATWQALTPAFPSASRSGESISPDARRLCIFIQSRKGVARQWEFPPTDLPLGDLQLLCRVWSGRRFDSDGYFVQMSPEEFEREYEVARAAHPDEFSPLSSPKVRAWHEQQAAEAVEASEMFAGEFHLNWLKQSLPSDIGDRYRLAGIQESLGYAYFKENRLVDAVDQLRGAAKSLEEIRRESTSELPAAYQLARIRENLAYFLEKLNRPDEVISEWQKVRDLEQLLVAARPINFEFARTLANTRTKLGIALSDAKRIPEAEVEFRAATELFGRVVARQESVNAEKERAALASERQGPKANGPPSANDLGWSLSQLGITLRDAGRLPEADAQFDRAVEIRRAVVERGLKDFINRRLFAWTLNHAARTAFLCKNFAKARRLVDEAEGHARAVLAGAPKDPDIRGILGYNRWNAAQILAAVGDHEPMRKCVADYLEFYGVTSRTAYEACCFMSLCVAPAEKDEKLTATRRKELAMKYAERAVEYLRQAIEKGWKDAKWIEKDSDLDPIRNREEFKRVLATIESRPQPVAPQLGPPPRELKSDRD